MPQEMRRGASSDIRAGSRRTTMMSNRIRRLAPDPNPIRCVRSIASHGLQVLGPSDSTRTRFRESGERAQRQTGARRSTEGGQRGSVPSGVRMTCATGKTRQPGASLAGLLRYSDTTGVSHDQSHVETKSATTSGDIWLFSDSPRTSMVTHHHQLSCGNGNRGRRGSCRRQPQP